MGALSGGTVLAYFCIIQFLTFLDRGVMSGLLKVAEQAFHLDGFSSGMLGSSFFFSIMVLAPLVGGYLVKASGRRQMYAIAFGSFIWALALVICALSNSYDMLLLGRCLSGVGEAFSCVLATPIIDDAAPPGRKSWYVGLFYAFVYVGTAVGFVASAPFADWESGRILFLVEALVMMPLVIMGVVWADKFHTATPEINESARELHQMTAWSHTMQVLLEPRYALLFFGYCAIIFSLNGFNFWCPYYIKDELHMSQGTYSLGAVVVVAGLTGNGVGGVMLDVVSARGRDSDARCRLACHISFVGAILSIPFGCIAMSGRDSTVFLLGTALYLFFLCVTTAPVCVGMMEAVDKQRRGIAMGLASFGAHIFGDVLSPIIAGALKDQTHSLVPGMWLLVLWVVWSSLCWGAASQVKGRRQAECALSAFIQ